MRVFHKFSVLIALAASEPAVDGRRDKMTQGDLLTPHNHADVRRKHSIQNSLRRDGFQLPKVPEEDPAAQPTYEERRRHRDHHHGIPHGSPEDILPLGGLASGDLRPLPQMQDPSSTDDARGIPISYVTLPEGPTGNLDDRTGELIGTEPCEEESNRPDIDVPGTQGSAAALDPDQLPTEIGHRERPVPIIPINLPDGSEGSPDGNGRVNPGDPGRPPCPTPAEIAELVNRLVEERLSEIDSTGAEAETTSEVVAEVTDEAVTGTGKQSADHVASATPAPIVTASQKSTPEVMDTEEITEYFVVRKDEEASIAKPEGRENPTSATALSTAELVGEELDELPVQARRLQAVFRKTIAPPLAPSFARLQNLVDNVAKTPLTDAEEGEANATAAELLPCLLRPGGCAVDDRSPSETKPAGQDRSGVLKKTQSQIAKAVTKLQKDLDMRTAEVVKEIERRAAEMRREIAQEAEQVIEAVKYLVTILADSVTRADEMGAGFVREWFNDAEHRYVGTPSGNQTEALDQDIRSWEADFKQQNHDAHKSMVDKLKSRVEKTREKYGQPKNGDELDVELGLDEDQGPTEAPPAESTRVTVTTTEEEDVKQLLDSINLKEPLHYGFIDA